MITIAELQQRKTKTKITALTAYDALCANIIDNSGIDIILVGDSLGMVVQGGNNTLSVSMTDMLYHTKIVAKQVKNSLLIADMPYKSYENISLALENAHKFYQHGAKMVKLEGGKEKESIIKALIADNIAVCGHLGLLPQSIKKASDYKVQGQTQYEADKIISNAKLLQQLGVKMLVLECVPATLAKKITNLLTIPTIGIGAGIDCDGQVLVLTDVLGMGKIPKFAKNFLQETNSIAGAVKVFNTAVKNKSFPTKEHSY